MKARILLILTILTFIGPRYVQAEENSLEVDVQVFTFQDLNKNGIPDDGENPLSMAIEVVKDGISNIYHTGADGTLILTYWVPSYYDETITVIPVVPIGWDSVSRGTYVVPLTYLIQPVVFGMYLCPSGYSYYFPLVSKCSLEQMYLGISVGGDDAILRWPFEPLDQMVIYHINDGEPLPNGTPVFSWGPLNHITVEWEGGSKDLGWTNQLYLHDSWFMLTPDPILFPDGSWLFKGGVEYSLTHSTCGRYVRYTVKWGPPPR